MGDTSDHYNENEPYQPPTRKRVGPTIRHEIKVFQSLPAVVEHMNSREDLAILVCVLQDAPFAYRAVIRYAQPKPKRDFSCMDCKGVGDMFMLHDHIWRDKFKLGKGIMCFGCANERMRTHYGRNIVPSIDLQDTPINRPYFILEESFRGVWP